MRRLSIINMKAGDPTHRVPWWWYNIVSKRLDNIACVNGEVNVQDDGILVNPFMAYGSGENTDFNWKVSGSGLELTITPGAIELGPDDVIEWEDITGHTETITLSAGTTNWWIWVNVDVEAGTAEMYHGATITALTSLEKRHIRQKRIARITLLDDVVTKIARAQCGNIDLSRSAG